MSPASSPALIIHLVPGDATLRDQLVELLSDYDLVAIHEDDLSAPKTWTAHFGSAETRASAANAIAARVDWADLRLETVDIEDGDWARKTQADLPAIRVGRVIVAPPWDLPAPDVAGNALVVEIEPSRGFGTGHHQSTRLCLVLLQGLSLESRTAIDVGTGSGVLAIVAAKLGAAYVSAIDVDPDAIENARENVARNAVAEKVEAHVRDFTEPGMPPADIVIANLTGSLLARHATALSLLVNPGGSLIVAGFTIDEKPLVLDAFEETLDATQSAEEDDWWALVLTRTS